MRSSFRVARGSENLVRWFAVAVALLVCAFALGACGGGSSSSSTSGATESSEPAESKESTEEGGEGESGSADAAAKAKKEVAAYVEGPGAFPTSEKLKEVPKDATVAVMNPGTPIAAYQYELLQKAAATMGVKVSETKTGPSVSALTSGLETIISQEPAAMIAEGSTPEVWKHQLEELQQNGTIIIGDGVSEEEKFSIEAGISGTPANDLAGELLAKYVVGEMNPEANIVLWSVPELGFTAEIVDTFTEEIEAICSKCSVDDQKITIEEIGSKAPGTVVSYFQSHPDTDVSVFTIDEITGGLPAAMQAAGSEVQTLGYAPGPTELQYVKEGKQTAALAFDFPVGTWALLDMAARGIIGQPLSGPQSEGIQPLQFLTQENEFDPSEGWTAYPKYEKQFAQLWGVGG